MTTETDNDNVFIPSIGILSSEPTDTLLFDVIGFDTNTGTTNTNVNLSLPNIINQINNIETIYYKIDDFNIY